MQGLRVAWLPDELRSAREILVSADITADVPDDPNVVEPQNRTVLAWALREAVTNVARHSGAENCSVSLSAGQLVVVDDGSGLTGRTEGNGLRGCVRESMLLGAHWSCATTPMGPAPEWR
ncbi:hypothetical protein [Ornithinimicrobium sp. INDO-MA30-4]|uniref:hypothetical protein n=1 Tax=Ornithinimicrobium sp. INDO-MA30-4 TaxID=2908651 RepID=UPI001F240BE7|nr:hypothetical protein [Ornithinimicrobium sp. INDO-MA30-4]UJH69903.1 hypothetical protein L0A91_11750 [Ornithinimicrobium sp. INDO-MA30-4]